MNIKSRIISGALCLLCVTVAHSATLYVNQNARNQGVNCTKKVPCELIQQALDIATKGTKVLVYPGYYLESLFIGQDNIKLESLTGPRHTFIANDGPTIIQVQGENATIGGKGKGFAIWRDTEAPTNGTVGVFVEANKIKIQGNHFWAFDFDYAADQAGPAIQGTDTGQATIIGNWFEAWFQGINLSANEKTKHTIQENKMTRMQDSCIVVDGFAGGTAKITKNNLNSCRDVEGESRVGSAAGVMVVYHGTPGKATIADNVVQRSPNGYVVYNGSHVLQRNQHTIGANGFTVREGNKVQIKDSATQFVEQAIFLDSDTTNTTISGNYLMANETLFHDRIDTSSIKSFTKNEIVRRGSGGELCAISLGNGDYSAGPIVLSGNHWGWFDGDADGSPDFSTDANCMGGNADTAFMNGSLQINKPVTDNIAPRYKDKISF